MSGKLPVVDWHNPANPLAWIKKPVTPLKTNISPKNQSLEDEWNFRFKGPFFGDIRPFSGGGGDKQHLNMHYQTQWKISPFISYLQQWFMTCYLQQQPGAIDNNIELHFLNYHSVSLTKTTYKLLYFKLLVFIMICTLYNVYIEYIYMYKL